jgi:hypothetical protein
MSEVLPPEQQIGVDAELLPYLIGSVGRSLKR